MLDSLTCSVQFSLRFRKSTKRVTTPGVEITSSMGGLGSVRNKQVNTLSTNLLKGSRHFTDRTTGCFRKPIKFVILQKNTPKSKISFSGHFVCFSWFKLYCVSQYRCGATLIKLWEMITLVFWYWGSTAPVETRRYRSCTQSRACCWQPGGSRIKQLCSCSVQLWSKQFFLF